MADSETTPSAEQRIENLERQMGLLNRQMQRLGEKVLGTIPILSLTLTISRRLELGFRALEDLSDDRLTPIVSLYIEEAKNSGLSFDDMVEPVVNVFGFIRAWKIINHEPIRLHYGEWGITKWRLMAEEHECEDEK